ncbi:P-loop containing nucleoside triphosphate hydrolase protein, partial [Neoconidiobolus thromboides FSU 785]
LGLENKFSKIYKEFEIPTNSETLKLSVIGPANAGKSSLINFIIGEKITSVSERPQTTRKRIAGILTFENKQLQFLDTPGVTTNLTNYKLTTGYNSKLKKNLKFNRELINSAWQCSNESDLVLVLLDGFKYLNMTNYAEDYIVDRVGEMLGKKKVIIGFNKIDLIAKEEKVELEMKEKIEKKLTIKYSDKLKEIENIEYFFISVKEQININLLKDYLLSQTLPGKWEYPQFLKTDQSDYERVMDIIKESYFVRLKSYLPYVFVQKNLNWDFNETENILRIDQLLIVNNIKHKKILVGANGQLINQVVQEATMNLRRLFKMKVKLYIYIKVEDKLNSLNNNEL